MTNPLATAKEGNSAATLGAAAVPGGTPPSCGGFSTRRQQQQHTCRRVRRAQARPTRAPTASTLKTLQAITGQKFPNIHRPERSITYPAQPPRVEADPGWERVEKTRPTAHSTKKETLHHPQLKAPSSEGGDVPLGDPARPGGGEGGEGGAPCGFFPKQKNERGGTPCHDFPVSFWVLLARELDGGVKIGRPPPHQPPTKIGPPYAIQSRTARTMARLMTMSYSQRIHLSATILRQAGVMHRTLRYS